MTGDREALRDWHRLFGLLLTDFFSGSPFLVQVERDLSEQQQLLDIVILRRKRGRFDGRLPDGLDDLAAHNLITFKSHREALDDWAMKELLGHYVAYRKLVSPSPSDLLPEDHFRLYAVCARFPHNLSGQVPWQQRQAGVYDCQWGTDQVRVVVAGQLAREAHNAPLHLFSASPELIEFGQTTYQRQSENTSMVLDKLFERLQRESVAMTYTMADFKRDYIKEHLSRMTRQERREVLEGLPIAERREFLKSLPIAERRAVLASLPAEDLREVLKSLPPDELLAGLSAEQIQQYLDQLSGGRRTEPRKPRRKK